MAPALGTHIKLLVPLALCLVACGGEEDEAGASSATPISMFTGRLETADSVVGLAVSARGDVDAYVCGGATTFATHSRWFVGSFSSGSASIEAEGSRLDISLRGETADITLTAADGVVHSTVAEHAGAGSRSALYESVAGVVCRWGVVVIDGGAGEPEVFGTWCDRIATEEIFAQVTPVEPIDFSDALLPVLVNTPAGEQRFYVRRAIVSRSAP